MKNDFGNIRLDRCQCGGVDKKMVSVGTQVNPMDIGGMRWQNWFIYLWGRDVTEKEEEMGHANVKVLKAKMMVQGYMRARDRIEERTGSFVSLK
jgi:hypothetical protein